MTGSESRTLELTRAPGSRLALRWLSPGWAPGPVQLCPLRGGSSGEVPPLQDSLPRHLPCRDPHSPASLPRGWRPCSLLRAVGVRPRDWAACAPDRHCPLPVLHSRSALLSMRLPRPRAQGSAPQHASWGPLGSLWPGRAGLGRAIWLRVLTEDLCPVPTWRWLQVKVCRPPGHSPRFLGHGGPEPLESLSPLTSEIL